MGEKSIAIWCHMIEHELKVKLIDRIKKKDAHLAVLLTELSNETAPKCDLNDINKFCYEYVGNCDFILLFLIEVNKFCDVSKQIATDSWLKELNICALYHLKTIDLKNASKQIKGDFFKLLLLSIAVNFAIGFDETIIIRPILRLNNSWKKYDLSKLKIDYDVIKETIFHGIDVVPALSILESNINKKDIGPRSEWLALLFESKTGLNYLKNNALKSYCITYEEDLLYQYSQLRYEDKKFLEMMNFGTPWPDVDSISKDELDKTKLYFNDSRVDFLIDLIGHTLFGNSFTSTDENELISILEDFTNNPCKPVPEIIYYIFDNFNTYSGATKGKIARLSKSFTNIITDVDSIYKYKQIGFLLGDNAMSELNTIYLSHKKQLLHATEASTFLQRLSDEYALSGLIEEDLPKLHKLFNKFTNGKSGIESSIYVSYEKMLREKLLPREDMSNENVRELMLLAMWKWQRTGFKKAASLLMKIESPKYEVPAKIVDDSNKEIVNDPMNYFFRSDMSFSEDTIIKSFESISESPTFLFTNNISLRPDFPRSTNIDDIDDVKARALFNDGTVQKILFEYFKRIRDANAYRLLNPFHTFSFYKSFLNRIHYILPISLGFWVADKELYNKLKKERPKASLMKYKKKKDYGMVTQLFPLLEDEIVKYSAFKGIVPLEFTNNSNFAHRLQPQALLSKLIVKAYEFYNGNIEMVGDLVWIYLIMYSEDGMNIRNNVIHGIDYPFGKSTLQFQFSLTLLCTAEMVRRNQMIKADEDGLLFEE